MVVPRLPIRVASSRSDSPKAIRSWTGTMGLLSTHPTPVTQRTPLLAQATICTTTNTSAEASQPARVCLPMPPQQPPLLMLVGDELHVSPQGIARSCYHLADDNGNASLHETVASRWTIEEQYCLTTSSKSYVIRSPLPSFLLQHEHPQHEHPFVTRTIIELQEVDTRLAGTGGTTWEASMVMALYFAHHAQELRGEIVELGSGVGLGGMLLHHVAHHGDQLVDSTSITLTDGSEQVLHRCRKNVQRYLATAAATTTTNNRCSSQISVKHLDWGDVLKKQQQQVANAQGKQYNTVIACDCAYRTHDVLGLKETLKSLLSREGQHKMENHSDGKNCIHLFGPINRAAYHELIEEMVHDKDLQVHVEWMELSKYRLAAGKPDLSQDVASLIRHPISTQQQYPPRGFDMRRWEDELKCASKSATKFLHVVAKHKVLGTNFHKNNQSCRSSLSEID